MSGRSIFSLLGWGSSPLRRTRAVLELCLDDDPAQVELRAAVCTHGDSHVLRKRCGQRLGDSHVEVHHNHLAGTLRGEASAQRGTYPVGAARHDDDFASRREVRHGRAVGLGEQHQTGWGSPLWAAASCTVCCALRWRSSTKTCSGREERTGTAKQALAAPMDGRLAPHFHFGVHLGR